MLRRARWPQSAPRLGVLAWQALSGSLLLTLLLAGVALNVPTSGLGGSLAELLHACLLAFRAEYAHPGGVVIHVLSTAATVAVAVRVGYLLTVGLHRAARSRALHLDRLRLASYREPRIDALIVDHPAAAAYCLPGRARTVVLTGAAVAVLDEGELAAVVHERAHVRGRHHLVVAAAGAPARTLPFVPGLRTAQVEQARLLEMIADDDAARGRARVTVARALVHLAEGSVPSVALGAADVAAAVRVQRMLGPARRVRTGRRLLIAVAITLTAATPALIVAAPAVAVMSQGSCPIGVAPAAASGLGA